mmetsp:Transcript_108618/g.346766  ORF Transcript_108618/g.346766 Transcript_108618/m.346766 type:complete len:424 (+) Transcript_108618:1802-3073(+)
MAVGSPCPGRCLSFPRPPRYSSSPRPQDLSNPPPGAEGVGSVRSHPRRQVSPSGRPRRYAKTEHCLHASKVSAPRRPSGRAARHFAGVGPAAHLEGAGGTHHWPPARRPKPSAPKLLPHLCRTAGAVANPATRPARHPKVRRLRRDPPKMALPELFSARLPVSRQQNRHKQSRKSAATAITSPAATHAPNGRRSTDPQLGHRPHHPVQERGRPEPALPGRGCAPTAATAGIPPSTIFPAPLRLQNDCSQRQLERLLWTPSPDSTPPRPRAVARLPSRQAVRDDADSRATTEHRSGRGAVPLRPPNHGPAARAQPELSSWAEAADPVTRILPRSAAMCRERHWNPANTETRPGTARNTPNDQAHPSTPRLTPKFGRRSVGTARQQLGPGQRQRSPRPPIRCRPSVRSRPTPCATSDRGGPVGAA